MTKHELHLLVPGCYMCSYDRSTGELELDSVEFVFAVKKFKTSRRTNRISYLSDYIFDAADYDRGMSSLSWTHTTVGIELSSNRHVSTTFPPTHVSELTKNAAATNGAGAKKKGIRKKRVPDEQR